MGLFVKRCVTPPIGSPFRLHAVLIFSSSLNAFQRPLHLYDEAQRSPASLSDLMSLSTPDECRLWSRGAQIHSGVWYSPEGNPCLPSRLWQVVTQIGPCVKRRMCAAVNAQWFTKRFSVFATGFYKKCLICAQNNSSRPTPLTQQAAHLPPIRPFQHVMMDFIELTPNEGKKYCLVKVDMFSKWVAAFPTKHATASRVTKALLTEILPRWGIPGKLSSSNWQNNGNLTSEHTEATVLNLEVLLNVKTA